jgi:ankyrin repeat protein
VVDAQGELLPFAFPLSKRFMMSVKTGDHNLMEAILESDPRVIKTTDSIGQTSLHWAAMRNDLPMARMLLSDLININAQDTAGRTPLYIAAMRDNHESV